MPKNLTGRTTLIVAVMLAALYILFPQFWRGDLTPNVRPGIDMVGGSSLLYQIKGSSDGTAPRADLAEKTIAALRQRIDPEGLKNLVWRAQGTDKIEIQLPATKETVAAAPIRKAYAAAQQTLDAFNVRPAQVEAALRQPVADRDAALKALAHGSPARQAVLDELAGIEKRLDDAKARQDAAADAAARIDYDAAIAKLSNANVEVAELDGALVATSAADRTARLNAIRGRSPGDASRDQAIDAYVDAHDKYQSVKNAVGDVGELKSLLKGSGVLSWHIAVKPLDAGPDVVQAMVERLDRDGPRPRAGDEMQWFPMDHTQGNVGGNSVARAHDGKTYLLAWTRADKSMRNRPDQQQWSLQQAYTTQGQNGDLVVAFSFDPVGASLFGDLTGRHQVDSPNGPFDLVAVLDNKVISNARLSSRIGAHGTISGGGAGGFGRTELDYLVRTLNAGALPAQLDEEPLVERTVGPQLGADNLKRGFIACIFGVGVVAVFLLGYYFYAGAVALLALLMNVTLVLAGMSALGATFTLPSVAGIVLTVGVAVDANVLIFERLREEMHRGLSFRVAMRQAYHAARSAILDSNVTAAIAGVILYTIGSEDVRGFGLTLLLGIVSSLFTSLFVTKTIFAFLVNRFGFDRFESVPTKFPAWEKFLHPNFDWMGKAWIFVSFSVAFIIIGFATMVVEFEKGRLLDIEFAGGTIVQFNLREPMPQDEARQVIEEEAAKGAGRIDAPAVQSIGDAVDTADGRRGYKSYEVVTVTSNATAVTGALSEALGGKLDAAKAATFANSTLTAEGALQAGTIVSIGADGRLNVGDFQPRSAADHAGGVAAILHDVTPMLSADEVRIRLNDRRVTAGNAANGAVALATRYDVEETPDGRGLVVLASDSSAAPDADAGGTLAAPVWDAVQDVVVHPATFARVSSISQAIAGETSASAVIALAVAIILIVIYVWIRFGDLKYGGATVVALVHDVLFLLASIGVAHLLSGTAIGRLLLLQPFRINLTMVSAVLAIIGFSMSDTVVIFDRIRENRNRLGRLDRQLINDSVNQTLSRTLLMAATTLATLFVMYITGGEAIHGFTFALFFGLLTGVYSSIAIASPLLLLGGKEREASLPPPTARPAMN